MKNAVIIASLSTSSNRDELLPRKTCRSRESRHDDDGGTVIHKQMQIARTVRRRYGRVKDARSHCHDVQIRLLHVNSAFCISPWTS